MCFDEKGWIVCTTEKSRKLVSKSFSHILSLHSTDYFPKKFETMIFPSEYWHVEAQCSADEYIAYNLIVLEKQSSDFERLEHRCHMLEKAMRYTESSNDEFMSRFKGMDIPAVKFLRQFTLQELEAVGY